MPKAFFKPHYNAINQLFIGKQMKYIIQRIPIISIKLILYYFQHLLNIQ